MTNVAQPSPEILARAARVRLMIFDVDGVLTDGSLWIGTRPDGTGEVMKRFNSLDGHGIKLLAAAGIRTAIITGRKSDAVAHRAAELGFDHVFQGAHDKRSAFSSLLQRESLPPGTCGFMGDDWPDLAVMLQAGFAACPAQAHAEVLARSHYVARTAGGHGAAREVCDFLLQAGGHYARLLDAALQPEHAPLVGAAN